MERKKTVVLDASVITKWYSKEKGTHLAIRYRSMHVEGELVIAEPSLAIYEVANALNYNPNFSEGDVKQSLQALIDLDLDLRCPDQGSISETIGIARNYGISVYDSTYLALAKILNAKMVTADNKFWRKVKDDPDAVLLA